DSGKRPTGFVETHALSYLYLNFDDIEQPHSSKQPPTSALIAQGLEFARGKDRLLVSCRAGRGRSTGMAYLICCQERGVAEAIQLLAATQRAAMRLVMSLGGAVLSNADVLAQLDGWRDRHRERRLSDYDERSENEFDVLEAQGATDRISSG